MKKSLYTLISTLLFSVTITSAQQLILGGKIEGTNSTNTHIKKLSNKYSNDNFIIGSFTDSLHLDLVSGGYSLIGGTPGIKHGFVAKYDPWGNVMWGFALGDPTDSLIINAMVEDYSGNLIIGGTLYGTANFSTFGGTVNLTSTSGGDAFIASYNSSSGTLNWVDLLETTGPTGSVNSLDFYSGYIYAGGNFDGVLDADPSGTTAFVTAVSGTDGFVASYDGSGNYLNSYLFGGTGSESVDVVSMSTYGEMTVAGKVSADIDLGAGGTPQIFNSNGLTDIFIGHYDYSMLYIAGTNIGGTGNDFVKSIYSGDYDFTVVSEYSGTVNFNPLSTAVNLTSNGLSDVAVAKFDFSLLNQYANSFGNTGVNRAHFVQSSTVGMAAKSLSTRAFSSGIAFSMNFSGTMDVDPAATTINISSTNTPINSAVIELDDFGNYKSHFVIEANSCNGMVADANLSNYITIVGDFKGTAVDLLPYDSISTQTHTVNYAGYYTNYDRCTFTVNAVLASTYECGTCNATITAQPSGAVGSVSYTWSNGDFYDYNQTATGACADNSNYYWLSATDDAGCSTTDSLWIYDHAYGFELDANISVIPTSCGNNFGSATATPINALGAVTYYWSNGDITNAADSLMAGNYFVHVTDSLMCYVSVPFTIDNSDGPSIVLDAAVNPTCGGVNSGSISVTISGGTAPYSFLWSNGTTTEDLAGVGPGTYSLIVTDAAGCSNQICATITAPYPLTVDYSGSAYANCFSNDGSVAVYAWGGSGSYTYQWDAAAFSQTNDTAINLFSGMYSVTVTDSLGCTVTRTFGVGDMTGPYAYTWNAGNPSCTGATGYIDVDVIGSGPYSYQWASGETTEDLSNATAGNYVLLVTDMFGCKGIYYNSLYQIVPLSPTVCMVTVDSTGTQNVVVWDKSLNPEAAYFNIYREGACSSIDFGKVGFTNNDSLSVFYDTVVNSDTRAWRYYVTCVDTCGYESWPSVVSRTIHLSSAFNASFDVDLNWGAYEGYPVTFYEVYRKNPAGTAFDFVDSVAAGTLTYTDTIDFSAYTEVEYFIDARTDFVCTASRAYNQNSARSNHARAFVVVDTTSSGIGIVDPVIVDDVIKIYPNPASDVVTISIKGGDGLPYQVDVLNQLGQNVRTINMLNQTSFSTRDLHSGIYFIRMKNTSQVVKTFKLIVSH